MGFSLIPTLVGDRHGWPQSWRCFFIEIFGFQ